MPTSPLVQFLLALSVGTCLLAIWKGGAAERLGGLLILINLGIWIACGSIMPPSGRGVLVLAVDGLTALGLLAITLRYASLWLGGAMLLYAAQFTLHSYYFVTSRPPDRFHAMVNNFDFVGMIICLAAGTLLAMRTRAGRRVRLSA